MTPSDIDQIKKRHIMEGNVFEYHFLDVNREEDLDEILKDFFIKDLNMDNKLLNTLKVDAVLRKNGETYLVRYIDKEVQENRRKTNDNIDKDIVAFINKPPQWASNFQGLFKMAVRSLLEQHEFLSENGERINEAIQWSYLLKGEKLKPKINSGVK